MTTEALPFALEAMGVSPHAPAMLPPEVSNQQVTPHTAEVAAAPLPNPAIPEGVTNPDPRFVRSTAFEEAVQRGDRQAAVSILGEARGALLDDPQSTEYSDLMARAMAWKGKSESQPANEPKLESESDRRQALERAVQRGYSATTTDILDQVGEATNYGEEYQQLSDYIDRHARQEASKKPVLRAELGLAEAMKSGDREMVSLILDLAYQEGKKNNNYDHYKALYKQALGGDTQEYFAAANRNDVFLDALNVGYYNTVQNMLDWVKRRGEEKGSLHEYNRLYDYLSQKDLEALQNYRPHEIKELPEAIPRKSRMARAAAFVSRSLKGLISRR